MDEKVAGFEEKLQQLLQEARKKKNVLEDQEVRNFLPRISWIQKSGTRCTTFWTPTRWMSFA